MADAWNLVLTNFVEALRLVQPQLKALGLWLVNIAASAGVGLLVFIAAFVIAGILLPTRHRAISLRTVFPGGWLANVVINLPTWQGRLSAAWPVVY